MEKKKSEEKLGKKETAYTEIENESIFRDLIPFIVYLG